MGSTAIQVPQCRWTSTAQSAGAVICRRNRASRPAAGPLSGPKGRTAPACSSWAGDGLPGAEGVAGEVGGGVFVVDEASAPADLVVVQVRPGRQELEGVGGVAVAELHDAVERPAGGAVDGEVASG